MTWLRKRTMPRACTWVCLAVDGDSLSLRVGANGWDCGLPLWENVLSRENQKHFSDVLIGLLLKEKFYKHICVCKYILIYTHKMSFIYESEDSRTMNPITYPQPQQYPLMACLVSSLSLPTTPIFLSKFKTSCYFICEYFSMHF